MLLYDAFDALGEKFDLARQRTRCHGDDRELPAPAQLLRVIHEGEVVRVGAAKLVRVDVRIGTPIR